MEEVKRKLICIKCPRGCEIQTSVDGHGVIMEIEGNFCRLGEEYASEEIRDPRRTVTTTVRVKNGKHPLVPVWTSGPIPKDRIFELMDLTRHVELEAPVGKDRIVLENIFGLNIDVLASSAVKKAKKGASPKSSWQPRR